MSIWLGPPESQNEMTALRSCGAWPLPAALARAANSAGNERPAIPAIPVCKNQRREPTRIRSAGGEQTDSQSSKRGFDRTTDRTPGQKSSGRIFPRQSGGWISWRDLPIGLVGDCHPIG